jgi:two-component system sensor histidine kinase NreB
VILLDRDHKVMYASPSVSTLFGRSSEEIVGKPFAWFLDADQCGDVLRRLVNIEVSPSESFTASVRVRTVNGAWRQLQMNAQKARGDAPDEAVIATFQDVSQSTDFRPRTDGTAITRVGNTIDKLSLAIEQTADSVVITDRDGTIEYVNPAFETMTGFTREEVIGKNPRILRSGVHTQEFYERLWNTVLSGGTFRAIMTNRRRDGTLYDEDQTITPITDVSGNIDHFVSTGRDVTQRRRAQDALRRLNLQLECEAARFGGILHDEAGPFLTSAHITLADVCAEVEPRIREKLLTVRSHLDQLEKRLREISHENHPQVVRDLGLGDAVTVFVDAFSRRNGILVNVDSRLEMRYSVAIETLMYRLVQEGLTNVSRHANATRAMIHLYGDTRSVYCSVKDNGSGFDVAARGDDGAGLGLRLIQDRLEAVGGTLAIVSACGRGTELLATVPVQD